MTYGDKWGALSLQEKRTVRILELKREIETLRGNHKSVWKSVKMPTSKIFELAHIIEVVDKTLPEERLIGATRHRCLDRIRHHIKELERKPLVLSTGLIDRDPRRH